MKKIWILNHYASTMFVNQGGRHHWFAKNLLDHDYETKIFCSNQVHNSKKEISIDNQLFTEKLAEGIPYVFVKSTKYQNNNIYRLLNIIIFSINLIRTLKKYIKLIEKPDVIMASSVHPLTWYAGYRICNKFKIPLIIEVRDLWPESLVAYGHLKPKSIIAKILYTYERWVYSKSDAVVMSWEGGKKYIIDKKWDHLIDIDKVYYISNGYDESSFDKALTNWYRDSEFNKKTNTFKIVYTGSIREVNNLDMIVETARLARFNNLPVNFWIFGDGDQREKLIQKCNRENIDNIIFKEPVIKKYIPSILKQSDIILIHNKSTILDRYGQSQNKLFEAIAANKPIVQTYRPSYSPLDNYELGYSVERQNPSDILKLIGQVINKLNSSPNDALREMFEFKYLTNKLANVINQVTEK